MSTNSYRAMPLGLDVQETNIGLGVFATAPFGRDREVGVMVGEIIADPDYSDDYCVDLEDAVMIPIAPFRYLNHCCEPNCELLLDQDEPNQLSVLTLRKIRPGEQLTIDYGWPAENAIACECGSTACRGWVTAEAELQRLSRRLKRGRRAGGRPERVRAAL